MNEGQLRALSPELTGDHPDQEDGIFNDNNPEYFDPGSITLDENEQIEAA